MKRNRLMEPDDETAVSEITILPDGRVFVLGASRQVLEILTVLDPGDAGVKQRLEHAGGAGPCADAKRGDDRKMSERTANRCVGRVCSHTPSDGGTETHPTTGGCQP